MGVKGVAKRYDWPADNLKTDNPDRHFVALVCFEGRIDDTQMPTPRVWIVPFAEIERFKRLFPRGRVDVSRKRLVEEGTEFENAWHLVVGR